ncbi:MAG TPA: HlyD family efflux transporter periplasmic adaptor subunit [Burkholderiales bacterium]|nr:HlyD family efflux transporter periplasmic adaptor subunit [Burkholderiales bacterium]
MAEPATPAANANGKRRRALAIVLLVFAVGGIGYGVYWWMTGRYYEYTDDAYVAGNVVQITPQVAGTVIAVRADDTDYVKAGEVLVQLDRADVKVALELAEAQLARTVRQVRTLYANDAQLAATVTLRAAELAKAKDDLARREHAAGSGAVSAEDVQHARDAVRTAEAVLAAAREQLAASRALTDNTTVADHPDVKAAAARVHAAFLDYARTEILAPVSGFVAKRNVQVGQRVAPGSPLMAVVPLGDVWVDANYKESQLADVRVGQPVELSSDVYGDDVEYRGTVVGFGAGTGSAFALLPAQNATGNWIKVVQRLPLRIALEPQQLAAHPLQIGLSMRAYIDTHDRSGKRLVETVRRHAGQRTDVFASLDKRAAQRVAEIIAANSASRPAAGPRAGAAPRHPG